MSLKDNATLYELHDRGQTVDGSADDVRGREVKDNAGVSIGTVTELLVDDREEKVRFLMVGHGGLLGLGETTTLVPVDVVTKITEDAVFIDQSSERVSSAPGYSPELVDDRPHHSRIYRHYGLAPYWGDNYIYPMGLMI